MPCAGAELFEPKLRRRGDSRMAELVPFTVPTESDKTLLVGAGDVAQAVARSPGMRAARVRSSAPHTNKDVVSAEK